MDIKAEKIELIKLLAETSSPKIIASIKKIFQNEKASDFWEELSEDQKREILQGTLEIEKGNVVDYEEFIAKHRE